MPELTALPLAIGTLMLARGELDRPGMIAPEACIEPAPFLAELQRRGVAVQDMTGQWPQAMAAPVGPSPVALALAGLGIWILLRWWRGRERNR
jgi:hypothetical protein